MIKQRHLNEKVSLSVRLYFLKEDDKETGRYYQNINPNFKSTEMNELILVSPRHK